MQTSRCVFSTASALHRVFITPIEQSSSKLLRLTTPRTTIFNAPLPIQQRRTVMLKQTSNVVAEKRLPRNEEIKTWKIILVNAENKLDEPRNTAEILASLDLKTHMLQMVVEGEEGVPPICKIINKKEAFAAKKAAKKAGKNPGTVTKTIELNWAIDGNDLGHRLDRIRDFLEKGNKVEVVLATKKKGRQASIEEAEGLVKKVKEYVEGVEGARVAKPEEGKISSLLTLFFQGKKKGGKEEKMEATGAEEGGEATVEEKVLEAVSAEA